MGTQEFTYWIAYTARKKKREEDELKKAGKGKKRPGRRR